MKWHEDLAIARVELNQPCTCLSCSSKPFSSEVVSRNIYACPLISMAEESSPSVAGIV